MQDSLTRAIQSLTPRLEPYARDLGLPAPSRRGENRAVLRWRRNTEWAALALTTNLSTVKAGQLHDDTPAQAVARIELIQDLKSFLQRICRRSGLRKGSPPEALTRWCFTCRALEGTTEDSDALIPSHGDYDGGLEDELLKAGMHQRDVYDLMTDLACRARDGLQRLQSLSDDDTMEEDVEMDIDDEASIVNVSWNGKSFAITQRRYSTLRAAYERLGHAIDELPIRLFRLLARYEALGGEGYQAAVLGDTFEWLSKSLGVEHECFASPLNSTLPSFSSAFYDVDQYFGSVGPFLSLRHAFPNGGSFEANPPFLEEHMLATALYIELWMKDSSRYPLSFIVFVPAWDDTPSNAIMHRSRYLVKALTFQKQSHTYLPGFQHKPSRQQPGISYTKSYVFVLQNDLGREKWPVTESWISEFREVFSRGSPPSKRWRKDATRNGVK